MQLSPREIYPINRIIENHTDTATYYVRAVIRNVATNTIIKVSGNDYVNLTDLGNRRFSVNWLVPADVSGQGFYISITTSIYTDSGYTTKSENYGDRMETLLIQDRFNRSVGLGGGIDIDYKKIRKIVNEVMAEHMDKMEMPEMPEMPEIKEVDIETPIKALKDALVGKIEGIEMPKPMDMSPMMSKMEDIMTMMEEKHSENGDMNESSKQELKDCMTSMMEEMTKMQTEMQNSTNKEVSKSIESNVNKITERLDKMNIIEMKMPETKKEEPKYDPRITRLMQN